MNNKIKIFADGLTLNELIDYENLVDGFTFNPTLFRKLKVRNYLNFSKKILAFSRGKPVSLEVIADSHKEIIYQAEKLSSLSDNVYVKIPIVYTNGKLTIKAIEALVEKKIKLNITAIFLIEQIKLIINSIKDTDSILSVFAGRIFDSGRDASQVINKMSLFVHKNSKCKILWASPRMSYDVILAKKVNCDIITLPLSLIKKMKLFKKNLKNFSVETVRMFYNDAKKSRYKI
jgi:transaldolase